ncbi:MAG TPA: putative quinol monooxygenase [Terracidiphilus sp.]|nr:putative quinol monooxygenase [Terracidiphilus sp.]
MLLITGTIRLPAGKVTGARIAMKRMIEASRAEAGCEQYSYAEDVLDPGFIHVVELWRDQAALDRHFASGHIREWRACWPDLGVGDRNLRVYEVSEPRPI